MHEEVDVVGIMEIAARLGVSHQTVKQWSAAGLLPEPRWRVSGRPAFDWEEIQEWAEKTGRLSGSLLRFRGRRTETVHPKDDIL